MDDYGTSDSYFSFKSEISNGSEVCVSLENLMTHKFQALDYKNKCEKSYITMKKVKINFSKFSFTVSNDKSIEYHLLKNSL